LRGVEPVAVPATKRSGCSYEVDGLEIDPRKAIHFPSGLGAMRSIWPSMVATRAISPPAAGTENNSL